MSLTIVYRSKNIRLARSFRPWQVATCIAAVAAGIVALLWQKGPNEAQLRVDIAQQNLISQSNEVEQLKQHTEEKVAGMLLKLGEMQGQVLRLNALGQKLVEQSQLDPDEFSFNQLPAVGGPNVAVEDLSTFSNSNLLEDMDSLLADLDDKRQQLQALESVLMNHHIDEQRYLSGRPIQSGWLSSYYGVRKDPFSGLPAMHKGLDFAGKEGASVVSTGAGLVTWVGSRYGYGNLIEIDHGDGLVTRYGHNKKIDVHVGDVVTKGQIIGRMGKTGRATGAHVHYEVLKHGKQIDPLPFVFRKSS